MEPVVSLGLMAAMYIGFCMIYWTFFFGILIALVLSLTRKSRD